MARPDSQRQPAQRAMQAGFDGSKVNRPSSAEDASCDDLAVHKLSFKAYMHDVLEKLGGQNRNSARVQGLKTTFKDWAVNYLFDELKTQVSLHKGEDSDSAPALAQAPVQQPASSLPALGDAKNMPSKKAAAKAQQKEDSAKQAMKVPGARIEPSNIQKKSLEDQR